MPRRPERSETLVQQRSFLPWLFLHLPKRRPTIFIRLPPPLRYYFRADKTPRPANASDSGRSMPGTRIAYEFAGLREVADQSLKTLGVLLPLASFFDSFAR